MATVVHKPGNAIAKASGNFLIHAIAKVFVRLAKHVPLNVKKKISPKKSCAISLVIGRLPNLVHCLQKKMAVYKKKMMQDGKRPLK